MAEMITVDDRNQDTLSRKAGRYLYVDTRLWLEDEQVHRGDGPAVLSPDGAEIWYVRGKEVTRAVTAFFFQRKWSMQRGLNTPEKIIEFGARFLK